MVLFLIFKIIIYYVDVFVVLRLQVTECTMSLTGAQPVRLRIYRKHPKVSKAWETGAKYVVANLNQNPTRRALCGSLCPTLLRAGTMWLVSKEGEDDPIERPLMAEDCQPLLSLHMFWFVCISQKLNGLIYPSNTRNISSSWVGQCCLSFADG